MLPIPSFHALGRPASRFCLRGRLPRGRAATHRVYVTWSGHSLGLSWFRSWFQPALDAGRKETLLGVTGGVATFSAHEIDGINCGYEKSSGPCSGGGGAKESWRKASRTQRRLTNPLPLLGVGGQAFTLEASPGKTCGLCQAPMAQTLPPAILPRPARLKRPLSRPGALGLHPFARCNIVSCLYHTAWGTGWGMWFTKGFIQNLQWRGFRCSREGSKLLRNDSLRGSLCELRPTSGKLWDACPGLPVVFCTAFEEKAVFPPFLWIRSNPSAISDRTPASSLSNRHSHGILTDPFRTRKDGQIHHPVRGSSAPSALRLPFPGDTARPSRVPSTWPEEQNPWDWKIGHEGRVRFHARAAVDEADCAAEKHCIRDTVPSGRLRGETAWTRERDSTRTEAKTKRVEGNAAARTRQADQVGTKDAQVAQRVGRKNVRQAWH